MSYPTAVIRYTEHQKSYTSLLFVIIFQILMTFEKKKNEYEWAGYLEQMLSVSSEIVQSVLAELKKKMLKTPILTPKSNQSNFHRKLWLVCVSYGARNEKNTA